MSDVQTPAPPPTGRQCPRCGAPMTEPQDWCLTCGAAVGTRVTAARGWRAPLVAAGLLAVIAAVAIAVAIIQLADDTDQVAQNPPATVAPTASPAPTLPDPSATPGATATPEASATPEATGTPGAGVADWPAGSSGWTVVLASTTSKAEAEQRAQRLLGDGIAEIGVLRSDDFGSLKPGYWVVFSGRYDTQAAARAALDGIDASDAYVRRIAPS